MSIFNRAVKTLNDVGEYIDYLEGNIAYVTALEAEGLLMPDLPEPDVVKLNGDIKCFAGEGKQVSFDKRSGWIQLMLNGPLLPTEARELAYALLAAADYAGKEQDSER